MTRKGSAVNEWRLVTARLTELQGYRGMAAEASHTRVRNFRGNTDGSRYV